MVARQDEELDELGQNDLDQQVRAFMHQLLDTGRAEYFCIDDDGEFRFIPTGRAWHEVTEANEDAQAQTPPVEPLSMFYRYWLPLASVTTGAVLGTAFTHILG